MVLKNSEVLKILQQRGAAEFYHANSVMTSCTFLRAGALLSREYVESHGLKQTRQGSDDLDKKYGIWNDIFLDTVDIHERGRTKNHYGPVLFVLDAASVLKDKSLEGTLRITRQNPIHWVDGQKPKDRYFETVEEFDEAFRFGDFGKHLTFRIKDGKLPLARHLDLIVLDDPGDTLGDPKVYKHALSALNSAAKEGGLKADIGRRECPGRCRCLEKYKAEKAAQKAMFAP